MPRTANPATDFTLSVEGVGQFTFCRRKMADEIKIGVEYSRLTEGVQHPTPWLHTVCTWISDLKVLTVKSPDSWNIDDLDPLDQATYAKMLDVHSALVLHEAATRQKKAPAAAPVEAATA